MARWRSPVPYSKVISSEQSRERLAGADVVADGTGGFSTGSKSGAYDYLPRRRVISAPVNTQGSKQAAGGMDTGSSGPKSQSIRLGSRTRGPNG